jgi:hypothetical protein
MDLPNATDRRTNATSPNQVRQAWCFNVDPVVCFNR